MGTYAVFWDFGKITRMRVSMAIDAYTTYFGARPTQMVAPAHREPEARAAAAACSLALEIRQGLLAGEFWLGGNGGAMPEPEQLSLL